VWVSADWIVSIHCANKLVTIWHGKHLLPDSCQTVSIPFLTSTLPRYDICRPSVYLESDWLRTPCSSEIGIVIIHSLTIANVGGLAVSSRFQVRAKFCFNDQQRRRTLRYFQRSYRTMRVATHECTKIGMSNLQCISWYYYTDNILYWLSATGSYDVEFSSLHTVTDRILWSVKHWNMTWAAWCEGTFNLMSLVLRALFSDPLHKQLPITHKRRPIGKGCNVREIRATFRALLGYNNSETTGMSADLWWQRHLIRAQANFTKERSVYWLIGGSPLYSRPDGVFHGSSQKTRRHNATLLESK